MFKLLLHFVILVGALAGPIDPKKILSKDLLEDERQQPTIEILHSIDEKKEDGSFMFAYENSDGSFREEVGVVKDAGTEDEQIEISGSYRYTDEDGQLIEVKYTAGKDGFVPVGTNISPEISLAAKTAVEEAKRVRLEGEKH